MRAALSASGTKNLRQIFEMRSKTAWFVFLYAIEDRLFLFFCCCSPPALVLDIHDVNLDNSGLALDNRVVALHFVLDDVRVDTVSAPRGG